MRIVSLLPSATEIVCALGLEDWLVGVTHECDYPPSVRRLPRVTRTLIPTDATSGEIDRLVSDRLETTRALYTLDMEALEKLRPDLIVTQTLCGVCAVAEEEVRAAACALPGRPDIVNLEPMSLSDVLASIRQVGAVTGTDDRADAAVARLTARVDAVAIRSAGLTNRPRVLLLEWIDPPFSCGHWSPELVRLAGGVEGLGREGEPSRRLEWQEVLEWDPEVVVVACCGFDVERTLRDVPILFDVPGFEDVPAARAGRVFVVDGSQYFSRPGPRLVDSLEILAHALHPTVQPLPEDLPSPVCVDAPVRRSQTARPSG